MDSPLFSIYRCQVTGVNPPTGEITVGLYLGGNTVPLPHVLIAGNATSGIHWLPSLGDFVLVGYEPGQSPVLIGPYLDPSQAATLTPVLAPGEVRLAAGVTSQGNTIVSASAIIGSGAPAAATNYLRISIDGGATFWRVALTPD